MTTLDYDEWETSSGLPLDGATVKIIAAEFGYNADIGAGVVCMNMTFLDTDTENEVEQSFSVGKQGEPSRDGSELNSAPRLFSGRSNYGRLIASVKALVDNPKEIIGSPKAAEGWIGTQWTVGTVPVETTNPNNDEKKVKDAFVFTAFHGKEGSKKVGGGSGKKKAAAKPEPTEDEADAATAEDGDATDAGENPAGIDQSLWDKLVKLAKASDSHDEFSDAALEMKSVDSDPKAQAAVLRTKPGSVWYAVHGGA